MNTKILAQALRSKGPYGDTDLVHVNEQEKQLTKRQGGAGDVNTQSGHTEFDSVFTLFTVVKTVRVPHRPGALTARPAGRIICESSPIGQGCANRRFFSALCK